MIRWLALLLLLTIGVAQAQTPSLIPVPQNVPIPLVPNGLDSGGNLTSRQLRNTDIINPLPYSTSSSTAVLGFGQMIVSIDNPNGFIVGQVVQVTAPDGEYLIGAVVALDLTTFNVTINAIVPNQGAGIYTSFAIQVLGGSNINGVPVWAGLSIDGTTNLTNPSAAGAVVNLTIEPGKAFAQGAVVYSWAPADISTWFVANVISYNSATGAIQLFVSQTANTGLAYPTNYVSLVDTQGPAPSLIGYSSTAFGTSTLVPSRMKMTLGNPGALVNNGSSSTAAPTVGQTIQFVSQTNRFWPLDGQILATCYGDGTQRIAGQVWAYQTSSTNLYLSVTAVFGTINCSAWSLYLTTGPTSRISKYQMNGLRVSGTAAIGFTVQAGSVQDSTGTVDLVLAAAETATVRGVQLNGTATLNAGVVSGSSTTFLADFSVSATLTDLNDQLANLGYANVTTGAIFGFSTNTAVVTSIASNTSLTINIGFTSGGSGNVWRGLPSGGSIGNFPQTWGVVIARLDATGDCHTFQVSFTPSGAPDLPSGYTYYRVIAYSTMGGPAATVNIVQPLLASRSPQSPKAVFSATMTPTAVGITVSNVNTTTGLITLNAATLGGVPIVTGNSVVLTGAVPTGLTTGQAYYINVQTPGSVIVGATFFLYNSLAGAYAGGSTDKVIPSTGTTGWSFRYFAYTNVFSYGFDPNAPIGGTPGTTTQQWDANLAGGLAGTTGALAECVPSNMVDNAAVTQRAWTQGLNPVLTSTILLQFNNTNQWLSGAGTPNGTWAQQGTTAEQVRCKIWGALDKPIPANDNDLSERAVA